MHLTIDVLPSSVSPSIVLCHQLQMSAQTHIDAFALIMAACSVSYAQLLLQEENFSEALSNASKVWAPPRICRSLLHPHISTFLRLPVHTLELSWSMSARHLLQT